MNEPMSYSYFGDGSIHNLGQIIQSVNPHKVFLVTGGDSYESSGSKEKIDKFLIGKDQFRYYGFEENPKFPDLLDGAKKINEFVPDLIIAIGGGSVIDTAKIISVLPTQKKKLKN